VCPASLLMGLFVSPQDHSASLRLRRLSIVLVWPVLDTRLYAYSWSAKANFVHCGSSCMQPRRLLTMAKYSRSKSVLRDSPCCGSLCSRCWINLLVDRRCAPTLIQLNSLRIRLLHKLSVYICVCWTLFTFFMQMPYAFMISLLNLFNLIQYLWLC